MTVSHHNPGGLDEFRPPRKNTGKFILVGCLSFLIDGLLLAGIGGVIAWQNWRGWTAKFSVAAIEETLKEIHLPAHEQAALMQRARLFADEFIAQRITFDEFQRLGDAVGKSELLPMLISKAMYGGYIAPSTLSDEDKARGELAFGRLARGYADGTLTDDDMEPVVAPLTKSGTFSVQLFKRKKSNFQMRAPREVAGADLLLVIQNAEKLAQEKELPPEPLRVDIVQELDRIVEETLGRKIAPPADLPPK